MEAGRIFRGSRGGYYQRDGCEEPGFELIGREQQIHCLDEKVKKLFCYCFAKRESNGGGVDG